MSARPQPNPRREHILGLFELVPGVPPKLVPFLKRLTGPRWADVLLHLPAGGVDRRHLCTIAEAEPGQLATMRVKITGHQMPPPRARLPWKIDAEDDTGHLTLIFFNHGPWLARKFPEGGLMYVSGTVEGFLTEKQMVHPEALLAEGPPERLARIWPTYPLTSGITQAMVARAADEALRLLAQEPAAFKEWLPADLLFARSWPGFVQSFLALHSPAGMEVFDHAHPTRQRLAFDELLAWQIALLKARAGTRQQPGYAHPPAFTRRKALLDSLPFKLTNDQTTVVAEIDADMGRLEPMLRLLQGDVGAGKTLVAFLAMLRAVDAGHQAALMAPTEILATQHLANAKKWLEPLGVRLALLTGKLKASEKKRLSAALAAGEVDIVIGTHAVIQDTVQFKSLSLAVIDEQHRFGVRQRLALSGKGPMCDVLVMTATPIPRTLSLTMYGDMDVSNLREKPPGRTPITTKVMSLDRLSDLADAVGRLMEKGEQVYWVCPLVEESEKSDLAAATDRYEHLAAKYPGQVGLIHGRLKAAEKDTVMADFKSGALKLLVSTTVIEVGVDVPQATTIVIEHAERFGLAQLHQLRGRVGRGNLPSTCLLLYGAPLGQIARERLETLRTSDDGFYIAEKDLELRGPGETLGTQQSGHLVTRIASLTTDRELVPLARRVAQDLLTNPDLPPETAAAVRFLVKFFNRDEAEKLLQSG
jgi:ATP-dependent DNA helicase RecG